MRTIYVIADKSSDMYVGRGYSENGLTPRLKSATTFPSMEKAEEEAKKLGDWAVALEEKIEGGTEVTIDDLREHGRLLTVGDAKRLKGKKIAIMYPVYRGNQTTVKTFTVGDVVSEWDYAKTTECEGYRNLQEYWKTIMPEAKIKDYKNRLCLLDYEGQQTFCKTMSWDYHFWKKEPVDTMPFECGDAERYVTYLELN